MVRDPYNPSNLYWYPMVLQYHKSTEATMIFAKLCAISSQSNIESNWLFWKMASDFRNQLIRINQLAIRFIVKDVKLVLSYYMPPRHGAKICLPYEVMS